MTMHVADALDRIGELEIDRQEQRLAMTLGGDRVGQLGELLLAPRNEHELVALPRRIRGRAPSRCPRTRR